MFVLDTNVLVYAADRGCPEYAACRGLVERARAEPMPWYLTWSVIYEFLRVTTHRAVWDEPWSLDGAWRFVTALLAAPGCDVLVPTERHAVLAERTFEEVPGLAGNILHDAHTAVLMREHGIRRIYTRDTDFHRFAFLDVLDPLTTS